MPYSHTRYERNPDYIYRRIADETVLVPIRRHAADMECLYTLNEMGAFIWGRLDTPATEIELSQAILDEYAADEAVVSADLERFLAEMVSHGAIHKV